MILHERGASEVAAGPDFFEDVRQAYDQVAETYYSLFRDEMAQKAYDRALLDQFAASLGKDAVVCDAGCGPAGHIGRYLRDKGLDVYGVDISERCVELARRANPGMRLEVENIAHLAAAAGSLDGVLSFYATIHTPKKHQELIFREFHRVLRPGGKLLLVVKANSGEGYTEELLGQKTRVWFAHFSPEEIRRLLVNHGFAVTFRETRQPHEFEISSPRIYAIGEKL